MKNSTKKRYSQHTLSTRAYCALQSNASKRYCNKKCNTKWNYNTTQNIQIQLLCFTAFCQAVIYSFFQLCILHIFYSYKPPVLSFMCGMNHNDARFQLHMQCICICSCTHPVFSFMCNMRHNDGSFQLCTQHISTVANCKYSTLILQKCFMKECSAMQILHNFNASRQLWIRNRELTCL